MLEVIARSLVLGTHGVAETLGTLGVLGGDLVPGILAAIGERESLSMATVSQLTTVRAGEGSTRSQEAVC